MAPNPFDSAAVKTSFLAAFGAWAVNLVDRVMDRLERRRQSRQLDSLSDAMLADIGIGRCDIERVKRGAVRGRGMAA
ncbi:DUF1127 domain-containing protein [Inquilinus limosus]|uniref:DUF1127 domain-containing protein n=1 Tax=Inquilinus limosus TaxID=171674 RepID=UPI003F17CF6A